MISAAEFEQYAREGYNRIPVVREVLSDLDTPLSVYLKLADGPYAYLFESVEGGARWGRYSIIGLPAKRIVRVRGKRVDIVDEGEVVETREVDDPLAEIAAIKSRYRMPRIDGLPKFSGGLVGYFGYECASYVEPRIDARAARRFHLDGGSELTVFFEVSNLLSRNNDCCVEYQLEDEEQEEVFLDVETTDSLAFVPSVGVIWKF